MPQVEPVTVRASTPTGQQTDAFYNPRASNESFMGQCPDCGSSLEFAEGCVKCHVCGFSECG